MASGPDRIAAALAEDAAYRHPGVTEGIYSLDSLAPFARSDLGVPTIVPLAYDLTSLVRSESGHPRIPLVSIAFTRARDDSEFRARLKQAAPFLESFDFQRHGLRLAGGAVSGILMNSPDLSRFYSSYSDFDLFIVGREVDARASIEALGAHLHQRWGCVEVYRTQNCVTFRSTTPRELRTGGPSGPWTVLYRHDIVQVILRRYSTDAEVLHGFDMGSSAAMWDGSRVTLTALGKLAAEHGVNVLNLAARRGSYERRLARYFVRGYSLVLPDLDLDQLAENGGRLPYLYVEPLTAQPPGANHLGSLRLWATRPGLGDTGWAEGEDEDSDYSPSQIAYGNLVLLAERNIHAADRKEGGHLCAYSVYQPGVTDIFAAPAYIDWGHLAAKVRTCFGNANAVRVETLQEFFAPSEVGVLLAAYTMPIEGALEQLIRHLCQRRVDALGVVEIPFRLMAVEDKTALSGSQTGVIPAAEWYGDAYAEH
jgi:hypothetical protein